jgi:hypothetical protein
VWSEGQACTPDGCQAFSTAHNLESLSDDRRNETQVTVNANESIMLYEHFQATDATPLHPDDRARRHGQNRSADRSRQIHAIMKCACQRLIGKDAGAKR